MGSPISTDRSAATASSGGSLTSRWARWAELRVLRRQRPTLVFARPSRLGHNHPPEPIDRIGGLTVRLAETHSDFVARFHDLERSCARVLDPLESQEDATTLTDLIAARQRHIKKAEATHKQEKELFLKAGRAVDAFFKRGCDKLTAALALVVSRFNACRDQPALLECQRRADARRAAEVEACRAAVDADKHRAAAEWLGREAQNLVDRRRAAQGLQLPAAAAERGEIAGREASAALKPTPRRMAHSALCCAGCSPRPWSSLP